MIGIFKDKVDKDSRTLILNIVFFDLRIYFTDNQIAKKSKRNSGDVRKSIPRQIEKLKQSIAEKSQVDVQRQVKLLLKSDRSRQVNSPASVDVSFQVLFLY